MQKSLSILSILCVIVVGLLFFFELMNVKKKVNDNLYVTDGILSNIDPKLLNRVNNMTNAVGATVKNQMITIEELRQFINNAEKEGYMDILRELSSQKKKETEEINTAKQLRSAGFKKEEVDAKVNAALALEEELKRLEQEESQMQEESQEQEIQEHGEEDDFEKITEISEKDEEMMAQLINKQTVQ